MCFILQHKQEKIEHGKVSSDFTNKGTYSMFHSLIKSWKKIFFTVLSLVWRTFLCFSHCGLWQDAAVDTEVRQCKHKFAGILKFSYQAQIFYDLCKVMFCTQTFMYNTTVKTSTEEWLYNVDECCPLSLRLYTLIC